MELNPLKRVLLSRFIKFKYKKTAHLERFLFFFSTIYSGSIILKSSIKAVV